MVKNNGKDTKSLEKKAERLRKLANLQGFVSEGQIKEVSGSTTEIVYLRNLLEKEKIPINTFVRERKSVSISHRQRYPTPRHRGIAHYTDPTWVYLNSVGRVPLLSRGQEAQYAKQMEYAQGKLFTMAFRSQEALDSLYRIGDEFKRNVIECIDVLQVGEDEQTDIEKNEELKKNFLKTLSQIKRKNTQIEKGQACLE